MRLPAFCRHLGEIKASGCEEDSEQLRAARLQGLKGKAFGFRI